MMSCDTMRDEIKAYTDRQLSPWRRALVAWHIARCASCRERKELYTVITKELSEHDTATMPAGLKDEILTQVGASAPRPGAERGWSWSRARLGLAGGLLALIFVAYATAPLTLKPYQVHEVARQERSAEFAPRPTPEQLKFANQKMQEAFAKMARDRAKHSGGGTFGTDLPVNAASSVTRPASPPTPAARASAVETPAATLPEQPERRVHREASITVETRDPEAASTQIEDMVRGAGGFVATSNLGASDGALKSAQISVKVPVGQFDTILAQIAKLGDVKARSVTGEDITEKTSDARESERVLDDEAQRAEARLSVLGKHAKWDDQETARELRIQLAQSRARFELLRKLAQLSNIDITLTQTPKPVTPTQTGYLSDIGDSGRAAFGALAYALAQITSAALWVLAFAPLWLPIALLARKAHERAGRSTT